MDGTFTGGDMTACEGIHVAFIRIIGTAADLQEEPAYVVLIFPGSPDKNQSMPIIVPVDLGSPLCADLVSGFVVDGQELIVIHFSPRRVVALSLFEPASCRKGRSPYKAQNGGSKKNARKTAWPPSRLICFIAAA